MLLTRFAGTAGRFARAALAATALAAAAGPAARAQTTYTVTDLGAAPRTNRTFARALNAAGHVVGENALDTVTATGFLFDGAGVSALATLGGTQGGAVGINDAGWIVGWSRTKGGATRATLWRNGVPTNIDANGAGFGAYGINDGPSPMVVGDRFVKIQGSNVARACYWQAGRLYELGALNGRWSRALAVNDLGQAVGASDYGSPVIGTQAVLWENGSLVALGTLAGTGSRAVAINDVGQIVGYSNSAVPRPTGGFADRAVIWERDPLTGQYGIRDLGALAGLISRAAAVNASGSVVGVSYDAAMVSRAVVWPAGGPPVDLNAAADPVTGAGWVLQQAVGINDAGQIAGYGKRNGLDRSFLLTPQP